MASKAVTNQEMNHGVGDRPGSPTLFEYKLFQFHESMPICPFSAVLKVYPFRSHLQWFAASTLQYSSDNKGGINTGGL